MEVLVSINKDDGRVRVVVYENELELAEDLHDVPQEPGEWLYVATRVETGDIVPALPYDATPR